MIRITIDGQPVEVSPGDTILDGARRLGIDIPTLCYLERCGPMTSCLVCIVKVRINGRTSIVPSCGFKAVEGLEVESETTELRELRKSALELLLSDHVGDCLSPCSRICPLGLDIPRMLRQVEQGRTLEAVATVRDSLALPAVLGRLCHKPCENGCRRAGCDSAAGIRDVERFVADFAHALPAGGSQPVPAPSGRRVAIVGAGPSGLAAAYHLNRIGHHCVVFDRRSAAGGSLQDPVSRGDLAGAVLAREIQDLENAGIEFRTGQQLGKDVELTSLRADFDAVLLAVGEVARDEGPALGVALSSGGVKISDPASCQTSVPGVFAAGSAVRPVKQLVKAMAEGRSAAGAIATYLETGQPRKGVRPFSSVMGRLEPVELTRFLAASSPAPRVTPSLGPAEAFTPNEAAAESARCLHCDCRAAGNCRLQHYAGVYGAEFGRFPRQRRMFEQHRHSGRVVFEPGKCILCGICVSIASEAAEPMGLTFVGRGFDVHVAAPMNESFERGLQKVARECAEACPTGAIALEDLVTFQR